MPSGYRCHIKALQMDDIDDKNLVIVATFDFGWQAHIAQGLLEAEGIASFIDNELFASLYPIGFNTIGGVNLRVFAKDADRARQIIAESKA